MRYERIPIMRHEGVTLYGRVINTKGKLGRYEVIDESRGHEGEYASFAEAETRYNYLKSLRDKKERQ